MTDHLTAHLAAQPDAALFAAVARATAELLLTPAGADRDRLLCRGAYAAGWHAAVATGREALWRDAVEEGRRAVRAHDRDNYLRTKGVTCGDVSKR